jgi:hypothetical protein
MTVGNKKLLLIFFKCFLNWYVALNAYVYLSIIIRRAAAWNQVVCRGQLNCDNTRTEKRFRLSAKRTSPFKWQGRQFSRLPADEVGAPAVVMVVMLDTPCSVVVGRALATHSIRQFPLYFSSRASPCAIAFQLESTFLAFEGSYYQLWWLLLLSGGHHTLQKAKYRRNVAYQRTCCHHCALSIGWWRSWSKLWIIHQMHCSIHVRCLKQE